MKTPRYANVLLSRPLQDLIRNMLQPDPQKRMSIEEALLHPWINAPDQVASKVHRQNTIDELRKFNARRKLKVRVSLAPLALDPFLPPSSPVTTALTFHMILFVLLSYPLGLLTLHLFDLKNNKTGWLSCRSWYTTHDVHDPVCKGGLPCRTLS